MQRKFAVTSVIKIYSEMWELCMHPDYDHFIPLTLSLTVVWIEISEKKTPIFYSLGSCYPRLANRKKLIVPLEKYFKTLNNMINGTSGT